MSKETILVFDDDKTLLSIFTIVLQGCGYSVAVSETSHDIIEKVTETQPSAIIMDNWIPTIGGIKATQILKQHEQLKHIPVIYCSANRDVAQLARTAGAEEYLAKPFDLAELENTIARILKKVSRDSSNV